MTRSPLLRACMALRLPRGLYCLRGDLPLSDDLIRGDLPLSDDLIRLALRQQHVATERLVLALADVLDGMQRGEIEDSAEIWPIAAAVVKERDLPASMVGAHALAAMLPEEGAIDPDELGLWVEAAP